MSGASILLALTLTSTISYVILAAIALVILYIIFRIGRSIGKVIFGIIMNTVLGFAALFVLNYWLAISIPFTLPVIVVTALFGLPAVGTILILKLSGAIALAIL